MAWLNAGLSSVDNVSGPVAPLLQQVAADVKHFVKRFGYRRMPTRSELCNEGEKRAISEELSTIAETLR